MICFPNAKINIGLFVTDKRNDGYHNLETVFYPIPLKDALEVILAKETSIATHGLTVAGNPKNNLIWKAWELLQKDFPVLVKPVAIDLIKKIPMGAGMGGGSADGAFMLQLLNQFFDLKLDTLALSNYALQLGSDCPFFILNKPCFAKGRGEILESINLDLSAYSFQIICPKLHITTAQAFDNIKVQKAVFDLSKIGDLSISDWKNNIFNDFETTIFKAHPVLEKIKNQLYKQGALYAAMSGTGSTIYGIFEKNKKAEISADIELETYFF